MPAIEKILEKVRDTYFDTLSEGEYGRADADEIILGVVLSGLLDSGLSTVKEMQKALQSLQRYFEYLEE